MLRTANLTFEGRWQLERENKAKDVKYERGE